MPVLETQNLDTKEEQIPLKSRKITESQKSAHNFKKARELYKQKRINEKRFGFQSEPKSQGLQDTFDEKDTSKFCISAKQKTQK